MVRLVSLASVAIMILLIGVLQEARAQNRRPFDDYKPPSSVSPYLNLANNPNNNTATNLFVNYQLLVKPQLEQRRFNRQSTAELRELQKQQKQVAGTVNRSPSGSEGNHRLRSTGHVATRSNYSHYYPGFNRQEQ